ncbi:hypothetical protein, partial [Xanthomonas vasicola]|uniref:hypothetical protein n=1 Tax=Xanthomonas vasicola TaxID=56459 RepID=UPI001D08399A
RSILGGQFLFVEDFVPELRLLDAFTSMLAYGSPSCPLDSSDAVTDAAFMESEDYFKWHNSRHPGRESDRFVTLL